MKHIKLFEQFDEWDPFGEEKEHYYLDEKLAKLIMTIFDWRFVFIYVDENNLERFLKGMSEYFPEYEFPKYEDCKDMGDRYFSKIGNKIVDKTEPNCRGEFWRPFR